MEKRIQLHNCDNLELMSTLPNATIDVICIDPPYLYLKNQKLERAFNEPMFFSECKRLLTKSGFIVMFGRGTSFYRWNTLLDGLGFVFKEEIVWDKVQCSSPLLALSRFHENISIYCKGNGLIKRVKVPYLEMKENDAGSVIQDITRLKAALKNTKSLDAVSQFLETNKIAFEGENKNKHNLRGDCNDGDRCARTMNSIVSGMNEKSIIKVPRDHYTSIHPTQKPVRLLERLLALVIPSKPLNDIVVADFFAGSMSTMEAVYNMGMKGIATEIDKEYFNSGKERIEKLFNGQSDLFKQAI